MMNNPNCEAIKDYIQSQSRNKIVFYSEDILGIESLDIGENLAEVIYN